MATLGAGSASAEWRNHWPVVLAAMAGASLSSLHLYSLGVVLADIEQEFGWSRAQISLGPAIVSVVGLLLSPFVGMAIDRFGARRVGLGGSVLFLAVFSLLSTATSGILVWYALWTLLAIAAALISPTVWTAGVTSLFFQARGLALAVTLCGTGLGAISVPILSNFFLESFGWREVYRGLAGLWACITLPLLLIFFSSRSDQQRLRKSGEIGNRATALPGPPFREAFWSIQFFKLLLAAGLLALVTNAIVVNLVPILAFQSIDSADAAATAGLIGLGSICGRLIGGVLLDRINANLVAGISVAIPVISSLLLILAPGSVPVAAAAVLSLGLAVGVEFDAVAYLTARHFGMRSYGTLFGTITGVLVLVTGLGPFFANLAYDLTASYQPTLYACVPVCLVSSILFLTLGPPKNEIE